MKRRDFARITGIGIGSLFIPMTLSQFPSGLTPEDIFLDSGERKRLADRALNAALAGGASYADVRIGAHREQGIFTYNRTVQQIVDQNTCGISVRAIAAGAWGFAFQENTDANSLTETAAQAVANARRNAHDGYNCGAVPPPAEPGMHSWKTPALVDPFSLEDKEKKELLLSANSYVLDRGMVEVGSSLQSIKRIKYFASSAGVYTDQQFIEILPFFNVGLHDNRKQHQVSRQSNSTAAGMGLEYFNCGVYNFKEDMIAAIEEIREMQCAPPARSGEFDVILDPIHLAHVIRQTFAHELKSGMTSKKSGQIVASNMINLISDRNQKYSPAAAAYDDEGVRPVRKDIIKNGVLQVFDPAADGCSYAYNWRSEPRPVISDLSIRPGAKQVSLAQMIGGVENGYYIKGFARGESDPERNTFSADGQLSYEIKNGRLTGQVANLRYEADHDTFWKSCVQVCGAREYRVCGFISDAADVDGNTGPVTYGSAPLRFNGITVFAHDNTV